MNKKYDPPRISPAEALPEGELRALLAVLLLQPPTSSPAAERLYRAAIETLYRLDTRCIAANCRRSVAGRTVPLWRLCDPGALTGDIFAAAAILLRRRGCILQYRLPPHTEPVPLCARPLQYALTDLLRAAGAPGERVYASLGGGRQQYTITVSARGSSRTQTHGCAAAVAAMHGGCLLFTGDTVGICLSAPCKTAAAPWHSPGSERLLRDPLSCVRTGLYSV